jgi:tetratricopeptide (TPR) repeat protein
MDRETTPSGRSSRATTRSKHFLDWVQLEADEPAEVVQPEADKPAAAPAKPAAKRAAKPAAKSVTKPVAKQKAKPAEKPSLVVTFDGGDDDDIYEDPAPAPRVRSGRPVWRSRRLLVAAAAAAVATLVFGVYSMGKGSSVPPLSNPTGSQSSAAPQIDQAKVTALMKKISANPRDVAALQDLGDIYFQAGNYEAAGGFEERILKAEPNNVTALLALGACQFNLGNGSGAKANWLKVTRISPRETEAYYDLGFLYLSQNPPNMAMVEKEWNKVIAIDPNSEVAKSVRAHLKSFDKQSPSTAPTAKK